VPVVSSLKDRLAAGDAAGALALMHPLQRDLFSEIYGDIEGDLPAAAAKMEAFEIDLLREDRAIVRIRTTLSTPTGPRVYHFPVQLLRVGDGSWRIYDY
jgi:hypothetical protein